MGGTWVGQVGLLMRRFKIPSIVLPADHFLLSSAQRKAMFKRYSATVVRPAVDLGLSTPPTGVKGLAWGWMITCISSSRLQVLFNTWWSLRIRQALPSNARPACPACHTPAENLVLHMIHGCPVTAQRARARMKRNQNQIQTFIRNGKD